MELRHLRYFVAVAETLSYKKAAVQLHISAPPLMAQIHDLEDEIGNPLLERAGHFMQLTDVGKTFVIEARAILARADQGVTLVKLVARGQAGHLRVGYDEVAALGAIPRLVQAFRDTRPNVRLTLHYLRTHEQLLALSQCDLEVGFLSSPTASDDYAVHEISTEPLVVIVPESHVLTERREVSFDALSRVPLVMYSRALEPQLFRQVRRQFERANAVMHVIEECDTYLAIVNFVAQNRVCAIVPACVSRLGLLGVVYRPLALPRITCSLAMVTKLTRNALAETFHQFALSVFPTLQTVRQIDA